jgi:N-acetylmuramoyl-L-alanine amidase
MLERPARFWLIRTISMKLTPSSVRRRTFACWLLLAGILAPDLHAQSPAAQRYAATREDEQVVSGSPAATVDDFRFVVERYWAFVRRYPLNGYVDDALWQAGNLALEAHRRFGDDRDRLTAARMFEWLKTQYPSSSYIARVPAERPATQASAPAQSAQAVIRALRREALPEAVRITLEMDREVPFYQERIDHPSRLFFDLKGTKTTPALVDAVFHYDADVVRDIRLGRHPNDTTRIVLDLEGVSRYSVFTLYDPYRIVIDCEREAAAPPDLSIKAAELKPPTPEGLAVPSAPSVPASAPVIAPPSPPAPKAAAPVAPAANAGGKFSVARQLGLGVSRIVIDAGHGGHDPGATAFGISESELVLDVALRLEKLLQQHQGFEPVLTRRTNDYVTLEERTDIANRESADLFLSIHANASANATAHGVETYFLNFALNPQAEAVAARENAASSRTMNSLPGIIKAITLNSKLNESRDFAGLIQQSMVRGLRPANKQLKDLGVKQAPFMVLIGAAMPSVLAEISFVTNRAEARLLKTSAYRQKIAESLLAAILKYQQALKKVQTAALQ